MNVTSILTKDYENNRLVRQRQNKPNQTQPVVSLPVLSLSNQSKGSNLFQRQKNTQRLLERRRIISTRRTSRHGRGTASSCGSVDVRGECEREDCVSA